MALNESELKTLKIIKELKEVYGEAAVIVAEIGVPPDESERLCESLAASGYLEAVSGKKKYKLSAEGEKAAKG